MEEARIAIGERVEVEGAGMPSMKSMRGIVTGPNPHRRDGMAAYFKNWYVVRLDDGFVAGFDSCRVRRLTPLEALAEVDTAIRKNPVDEHLQLGDRIEIRNRFGETQRGTVVGLDDRWAPIVITDQGLKRAVVRKALRKLTPLELLAEAAPKKSKNNPGEIRPGSRVRVRRSAAQYRFGGEFEHGTVVLGISDMPSRDSLSRRYLVDLDSGLRMYFSENCVTALSPTEELAAIASKAKRNPDGFEVGDRIESTDEIGGLGRGTVLEVPLHWPWVYAKLDSGHDRIMLLQRQIRKLTPVEALAELAAVAPKAKKNPADDLHVGDRIREKGTGQKGTVILVYPMTHVLVKFDRETKSSLCVARKLEPLSDLELLAEVVLKKTKNNPRGFQVGNRVATKHASSQAIHGIGTVVGIDKRAFGREILVRFDAFPDEVLGVHFQHLVLISPLEELASLATKAKNNGGRTLLPVGTRVVVKRASRPRSGWLGVVHEDRLYTFQKVVFDDGYVAYIDPINMDEAGPLDELAGTGKDNPPRRQPKTKNNPTPALKVGDRVRWAGVVRSAFWSGRGVGTVESIVETFGRSQDVAVRFDKGPEAFMVLNSMNLSIVTPLEELAELSTKKANKNPVTRFQVGDRVRWDGKRGLWRFQNQKGAGTIEKIREDREYGQEVTVVFDISGKVYTVNAEHLALVSPLEELAELSPKKAKRNPLKAGYRVKCQRQHGQITPWEHGTVKGVISDMFGGGNEDRVFVKLDCGTDVYFPKSYVDRLSPVEELAALAPKVKKNPKPVFLPGDRVRMCKRFDPKASDVIGTVQFDPAPKPNKDVNIVLVQWDTGARNYQGRLHLVRVSPLEEMAALARKNPNSLIGRRVAMLSPHSGKHSRGTIEATFNGGAQYYVKMDTGQVWRLYPNEVQLLTDIEILAEAHRK